VIDAGHGGPDPGAIGIGGVREKDVVLSISQQVAALLQQQGIEVVMTRNDDSDVDLEPRVQLAEQVNATLFVSIHANAFRMDRPDINGLETFYYSTGDGLAQMVHRTILQNVKIGDRGVRTARFYVLRETSMPSILIETGYLTGQNDAPLLATDNFRTQMANAIARGILLYLGSG
jgi:N-acetylmuramoyl-L-alanine amidase